MAVAVTEYLGNRTDATINIAPQSSSNNTCPFNGKKCQKIIEGNKPVCSIRNYGRKTTLTQAELPSYPFWIVCSHRLCSTTIDKTTTNGRTTLKLTDYQQQMLLKIAREVFSQAVSQNEIFVNSEVGIRVNDDSRQDMHADYVMTYEPNILQQDDSGKRKVIIEMQGGGETSNTGPLTDAVGAWENGTTHTNAGLSALVSRVGILATNAWRRQQEQAIIKGKVADVTKGVHAFVLCMGKTLFDYLEKKLKFTEKDCGKNADWKFAIIVFKEDWNSPIVPGPIPLEVDKVIRIQSYTDFISAITAQGLPSPNAFAGDFVGLDNTMKKY